jgi:polygalacturonase
VIWQTIDPARRFPSRLALLLLAVSLAQVAHAQDRRNVTEPRIPPPCTTLTAALTAIDHDTTIPPAEETRLDTKRIQSAIDTCPAGHAVELKSDGARNSFLSGPLELRAGVTLLVDADTFLFASRNPRDYDVSPGACGVVNHDGRGCKPLIAADHVAHAGVMGNGVIDGRGGAQLLDQKVSWWDLAEQARGDDLRQNCPRLLQANHSNDFTLYRITLKNSPNFHVAYSGGDGLTAWGVIIDTPKHARNTDGIDPISATDVTITHCFIHAGDDNVAIKAGDLGPSSHITVAHNHFYTGHGMSIGSETLGGVSAVRVTDLSIDGADNGIRIKSNSSRGGLVHDVVYQDVCMRDTKNPILMDTHYSFYGSARNLLPVFDDVVLRDVRVEGGGKITLEGYDSTHRLGIEFDNMTLDDPQLVKIISSHADVKLGPGPVNFLPQGEDVQVSGKPGRGRPHPCDGKFVPMPRRSGS